MKLAGLIAVLLTVTVVATAAAYTTGKYRGKTAQGLKISFKAGKKRVTGLVFKETGTCSDGSQSSGSQGPIDARVKRGHFHVSGTSPSGATRSTVSGTLKRGGKASGTFRIVSHFDAAGNPDPNGSIECTTGTVHWSAKHRR